MMDCPKLQSLVHNHYYDSEARAGGNHLPRQLALAEESLRSRNWRA